MKNSVGMSWALKPVCTALLLLSLSACGLLSDEKKTVVAPLKELSAASATLGSQWSRSVGSQGDSMLALALTPAISGGTIYAANADGGVMAISRANGEVRWKTDLDAKLVGAVGAGGDMAFVSAANGSVYALDAATGAMRWQVQAGSEVLSAPVTDGSVVLVQSTDARLQAFEAATGRALWSYNATPAVLTLRGNSSPVMRAGAVFVAFDTGKVVALEAKTGMVGWERRFIVPEGRTELERIIDVQADPVLNGASVIVASYQGAIVNLAQDSGQPQWQEKASVVHSMAAADGTVFMVEGNDTVRALSMSTGRELWKAEGFENRKLSAPAVIGRYVAVADRLGYIHLLDQASGTYAGRYNVGGDGVRADLLSEGDTLYALTASGKLYALNIRY